MSNIEYSPKKKKGGRGKEGSLYSRSLRPGMEYLIKRPGSPNWFVRKGKIFESTRTDSDKIARIRREEILSAAKGIKRKYRLTISEIYSELIEIKCSTLQWESFRNHYTYPWKTLQPHFGEMFVDELNSADWKVFVGKIKKADPEKSVQNYYELLHSIISFAMESGHIKEDPEIKLDRSLERESVVAPWSDKEVEKILKNCEGPLKVLLTLMAFRGPRPKETRRLKKIFFDWEEGGINLPGFETIDGKSERYTKTGKPRFIPLGKLKKEIRAYCNSITTERLFEYTKDNLETAWEELRDGLGLTGGLYRFRHYAAVRLLKAGVNPITVAKIMGHDIKTLFRKYSRFLKKDLTDALKNL